MSYNTNIPIVNNGLVFVVDAGNPKGSKSEVRTQDVAEFSPTNKYLSIPDNPTINKSTEPFSVGFWVRRTTGLSASYLLQKGTTNGNFSYIIYIASNQMRAGFNVDGTIGGWSYVTPGATQMIVDQWYLLVITHDPSDVGNEIKLSQDGVFGTPNSLSGGVFPSTQDFRFGCINNLFVGNIKNCFVYDRALTEFECKVLYDRDRGITYNDLDGNFKTDLVSWWNLDEASGTTKFDSHGTNHLTDNNGVGITGDTNSPYNLQQELVDRLNYLEVNGDILTDGVFEFDGVNDSIDFPQGTFRPAIQDFTTECWVKINAIGSTQTIMYVDQNSTFSGNGEYFMFINSLGAINIGVRGAGGTLGITTTTINTDNWYHIVNTVALTPQESKIYINGVLEETDNSWTAIVDNPTAPMQLGKLGATNLPLNGDLSNFKIYNRVLTPSEVKQNYNATKYRFI